VGRARAGERPRYRVELATGVAKQLKAIPRQDQERISARIDALARDPRPVGSEKVEGQPGALRIRAGDDRVIDTVQDDRLIVLVLRVGHRREVYRDL
jgi:mRNA interferase RelE/StbE